MKRYSNLYNSITFEDMVDIYHKQIKVNTKNKRKIKIFEDYYSMNMVRAYNFIKDKNYVVGKYNIFMVEEPKHRIIMSQGIVDKLINHVVANKILLPILEKSLINTNVATRVDKGTHFGIKYLKKYLNEIKGEKIYALKFDISKFFYSIDHEILMDMLKKKIKDKDALDIIKKILDSTNHEYVNKEIERIKNQEISHISSKRIIKEINSLPIYKKGKGLPIGNMTSQILAIFYLNDLDHYIKEKLHVKYYIRYMDDGVLLSSDKKYLRKCLQEIIRELDKYKLKLNAKTKILDVSKEGIDFLGFRFLVKDKVVMRVRTDCKKRFKRKMKAIKEKKLPYDKALDVFNSYRAHLKWGNCYKLFNKYKSEP